MQDGGSPTATQRALVRHLTDACAGDARLTALFLAGSFASGDADAYSDVDFVALVPPAERDAFARDWIERLGRFEPVVFVQRPPGPVVLLNAVTTSWLRCDVVVAGEEMLLAHAQHTLQVLIDRIGVAARLPAQLPRSEPDRQRVRGMIDEFLRVLGLLAVVIGRGEHVAGVTGAGILRSLLIGILIEDAAVSRQGGALRVNHVLSPERRALLEALPPVAADRASIVAAHVAIAAAFLPLARALAARLELPWPTDFEAATRMRLVRELGVALPPS